MVAADGVALEVELLVLEGDMASLELGLVLGGDMASYRKEKNLCRAYPVGDMAGVSASDSSGSSEGQMGVGHGSYSQECLEEVEKEDLVVGES